MLGRPRVPNLGESHIAGGWPDQVTLEGRSGGRLSWRQGESWEIWEAVGRQSRTLGQKKEPWEILGRHVGGQDLES